MQNEYAAQLVAMPLTKFRSIRKAVAVLRRAGIPLETALQIILENQRAPYDSAISYASAVKR
jgi:hypothetical protein